MEVKPGYKLTEVGVIPVDWQVVTASDACELVVDCKNRTPPVVAESDYAVVRTPNVRDGNFVLEDLRFTDAESYRLWTARATPRIGDIMITREAPLGEVCAVPVGRKVCLGQRMMIYRPAAARTESNYLLYSLMSEPVRKNLFRKVGGSTVGHAKVDDIRFLELALPPLSEQRAIAEALRDVATLLSVLDRRIAKKRDLKQAAMQQLLTGQTRLPGFQGEWVSKRLGEVAKIKDGTHQTPKYVPAGIPFYSVEQVTSGNFENTKFISEHEHKFLTKTIKIEKGDILMTRIGSIGDCKLIDWDVEASFYVSLALLKIHKEISASYIAHYSNTVAFKKEVEIHSLPSAIPKKINLGPISELEIRIPPTLDEQVAVAKVLTDLDGEIAALVKRREKIRALKQAMMQELLTGKTRLR